MTFTSKKVLLVYAHQTGIFIEINGLLTALMQRIGTKMHHIRDASTVVANKNDKSASYIHKTQFEPV